MSAMQQDVRNAFMRMFATERGRGLCRRDKMERWKWISQDVRHNQLQYNCFYIGDLDCFGFGLNIEHKPAWEALRSANLAKLQMELKRLPIDYFFYAHWHPRPVRIGGCVTGQQLGTIPLGGSVSELDLRQLLNHWRAGTNRPGSGWTQWVGHLSIYSRFDPRTDYLTQMRETRKHLSPVETLIP
jgi:hypothetical protein